MTGAPIRPRRSLLYIPGSNRRALEKARTLGADAVILDLEDGVAPDAKDGARAEVCEAVRANAFAKREVIVRINALPSPWGQHDLLAAAAARPDAILVPKISTPHDLHAVESALAGVQVDLALWAMMETPLAILNAAAIAGSGGRLAALVMGTNDLIKEIGGVHTNDRLNLAGALGHCVLAARAHGLAIIDGVHNDIQDAQGFALSCAQGRSFGFDGKTLIHPSQIAACNDAFGPSQDEVAAARRIIAAFDVPENRDKGALMLDGRMIERLHADSARRILALAEAIAALAIS